MQDTSSIAKSPRVPAAFAADANRTGIAARTTVEPVVRHSRIKPIVLLSTCCLLFVVASGFALRSVNGWTKLNDRFNRLAAPESAALAAKLKTAARENDVDHRPPAEATSVPDAFVVGATVLAYWSDDGFWYPAKIEKQRDNKYDIRHLDGSTDTVTFEFLATENLREGDRISANWNGKGSYFMGKITSRDQNDLHISYDAGPEERTTLAAVRVQRAAPSTPREETVVHQYADETTEYYYEPAPSYVYQPPPTYSVPAYSPAYRPYTPTPPSYTPQQLVYSNGMTQNEYAMQQIDWTTKNR